MNRTNLRQSIHLILHQRACFENMFGLQPHSSYRMLRLCYQLRSRLAPFSKGPYIKDVRKNSGIFDTPLPLVRISRNLSVLFVRKIGQFVNPPPPLSADVLYAWSLGSRRRSVHQPRLRNRRPRSRWFFAAMHEHGASEPFPFPSLPADAADGWMGASAQL